jgi:ubiquinone/menaquinone biosynthesis C-methylase UbiE
MKSDLIVAGNIYDKYESANIVARLLMKGYLRAFDRQIAELIPKTILEVGCGEGYITHRLANRHKTSLTFAIDLSLDILRQASAQCGDSDFVCASADNLPFHDKHFDLVVCVETLEHLEEPLLALREIERVCKQYILVSVPREPIWHVLNLARGAYIRNWGNTPGHVQHWSVHQFVRLLEEHFNVLRVVTPLPWTMALCKVNNDGIL